MIKLPYFLKNRLRYRALQSVRRRFPRMMHGIPKRALALTRILHAQGIEPERAAEIGVWRGHSSIVFCRLWASLKEYHCIDSWANYADYSDSGDAIAENDFNVDKAIFLDRISPFNHIVSIHEGFSSDISSKFSDKYFDFIFIDANHAYEYVKKDIASWLPKVRGGGVLAGHDFDAPPYPGVRKAVEEMIPYPVYLAGDHVWWTVVP